MAWKGSKTIAELEAMLPPDPYSDRLVYFVSDSDVRDWVEWVSGSLAERDGKLTLKPSSLTESQPGRWLVSAGGMRNSTGDPSDTPARTGHLHVNTLARKIFIACATNDSSDWLQLAPPT